MKQFTKLVVLFVSINCSCHAFVLKTGYVVVNSNKNRNIQNNKDSIPTIRTTKQHQQLQQVSGNGAADFGSSDLTSALARLDRQWQIQQYKDGPSSKKSRWTKLSIKSTTDVETNKGVEYDIGYIIPKPDYMDTTDYVYLLEPPNFSTPSCIIVFTGGAGLGTYPQIAYNELLIRISNQMNAAIITVPYQVGLDHFSIAKVTGDKARKAIVQCQEDTNRLYSENLPIYSLSHSLGSKLSLIYTAATGIRYNGLGLISYNNFGIKNTIGMIQSFTDMIRKDQQENNKQTASASASNTSQDELMKGLFSMAETFIGAIGIEFTPTPKDTERLINMKFTKNDGQNNIRLFSFDTDQLDSSLEFTECCTNGDVSVSGLKGTHLTPVYFKFGWDELEGIDKTVQQIAKDAAGGFESASFGNEEELSLLVNEVCNWMKGKLPTQQPDWMKEPLKLTGTTISD